MIWIDPYWRVRCGRVEHVRGHWRRLPRRSSGLFRLRLSRKRTTEPPVALAAAASSLLLIDIRLNLFRVHADKAF